MKMSEIKTDDLKKYLRVDGNEDDVFITTVIDAAKQYVRTYTAQEDKFLDEYSDVVMAVFALCADMYDVRQVTVANDKVNPLVKQILDSYSRNWIG